MSSEKKKTGRIYKILNLDDDKDMFISSTFDKLYKRLWRHKKECDEQLFPMALLYVKMKGHKDNFRIELIEEGQFDNKTELLRRERFYINKEKPNLNEIIKDKPIDKIENRSEINDKKDDMEVLSTKQ